MHTHSCASDGSFSPSELVREAIRLGLYAFALTDHDTVSGIEELERASLELAYLRAVPGVEIAARFGEGSIHICGLFIDRFSSELNEILRWIREGRDKRNEKIIEKIQKLGYELYLNEVIESAGGESVGRPHFAKLLVSKGYFGTMQDVFDKLLKKGEAAYVERKLPSPEQAIDSIHKAGGISIWAHPFARKNLDRRQFRESLVYLKSLGLDGLEAYYSTYDKLTCEYLCQVAKDENMLISGGSDFHGENMDGVKMGSGMGGLSIPDAVFAPLDKHKPKKSS